jgi:hypothetical protein
MSHRRMGIVEHLRRRWHHMRGEHAVLTTFWPQDYRRGAIYQIDGQPYQITWCLRAPDGRFFEIWGRTAPSTAAVLVPAFS